MPLTHKRCHSLPLTRLLLISSSSSDLSSAFCFSDLATVNKIITPVVISVDVATVVAVVCGHVIPVAAATVVVGHVLPVADNDVVVVAVWARRSSSRFCALDIV